MQQHAAERLAGLEGKMRRHFGSGWGERLSSLNVHDVTRNPFISPDADRPWNNVSDADTRRLLDLVQKFYKTNPEFGLEPTHRGSNLGGLRGSQVGGDTMNMTIGDLYRAIEREIRTIENPAHQLKVIQQVEASLTSGASARASAATLAEIGGTVLGLAVAKRAATTLGSSKFTRSMSRPITSPSSSYTRPTYRPTGRARR